MQQAVQNQASDFLIKLRNIEVIATGCSCIPTLRRMLGEVHDVSRIAQMDHDVRSDLSGEWVEVVCLAEGLRQKIAHLLEQAATLPMISLDNVHPLFANALRPFVHSAPALSRAA